MAWFTTVKPGEVIRIGPDVQVALRWCSDGRAGLAVTAPREVTLTRVGQPKRPPESKGEPPCP